jgi:hypothetical protein
MGHRIAAHAAADALWGEIFPGETKPPALQRPCSGYQPAEFAAVKGY